jgi:dinuclear metal center YbgI/SA1388 family protein
MEKIITIQDIYDYLDKLSPFDTQEKWDNSGLIVGNMDDTFHKVYISLDLDKILIKNCDKGSLIITHHPLIFSGLKQINYDSYSTKLLRLIIKKDIKIISMHTNIDKSHLNRYVFEKILGFEVTKELDFICYGKININFNSLCRLIKERLNLDVLHTVKAKEDIKTIALTTGSGGSLLPYIKADCFLTGDIKYHEAMEAQSRKISIIDIKHYESEIHFSPLMMGLLRNYLKKNKIKGIIATSKNPFEYK